MMTKPSPLLSRAAALRYLAEFLVVFLGVTLSFVAENVREDRAERALERESLRRIAADLEEDLSDLPGNAVTARRGVAAIAWLQASNEEIQPSADSVVHYLKQYLTCSLVFANSSEYESLKSSGGLSRIQNVSFRQALTLHYERYPQMIQLHDRDCDTMMDPIEHITDQVRIISTATALQISLTGSVTEIVTNQRFRNALSEQSILRLMIGQVVDQRVRQLERLRDDALSLLAEM